MNTQPKQVVILGAGLAGLSTAYHLKGDYRIYEKEEAIGGLCRSQNTNGFIFDYDGHLLHFRNNYTLDLIKGLLNGNLLAHKRNSWIFSHGVYTRYPFQANFYGLAPEVIKQCLLGLVKARNLGREKIQNRFSDWILDTFGQGIAEHFMMPYNRKFWTVSPDELTCEWLDGFIPIPSLEDVVDGTLSSNSSSLGYNRQFWYPREGGIQEVSLALQKQLKAVRTLKEAVSIDIQSKEVEFKDGEVIVFDQLVSSLPLVEMRKLIPNLPGHIKQALGKLRYTSIFNLNLGIDKGNISDKHWIYFPEDDFVFFRIGFPMNFSSSVVPAGKSSIYTEVSYSQDKPINKETITKRIVQDLEKIGLLSASEVLAQHIADIEYGYIIYDRNYQQALKLILDFLARHNIHSVGRYGKWRYMSMEDSILDGKRMAEQLRKG